MAREGSGGDGLCVYGVDIETVCVYACGGETVDTAALHSQEAQLKNEKCCCCFSVLTCGTEQRRPKEKDNGKRSQEQDEEEEKEKQRVCGQERHRGQQRSVQHRLRVNVHKRERDLLSLITHVNVETR